MLHANDFLLIQEVKMKIALYVNEEDDEKSAQALQNISFLGITATKIEDEQSQLSYLYPYIEECAATNYSKYVLLMDKLLTETRFLTVVFNNEITKSEFLNLMTVWQLDDTYQNPTAVINFLKNNYEILKPFKTMTMTKNNLMIVLNYTSKLLRAFQCLSYQEMLDNKDYLNPVYADAEFLIDKKQEVGLE